MKAFGCLCYVDTIKQGRGKFDHRADACTFLGYPHGQKSYKVYNMRTKRIIISRDVIFHEKHFPCHHKNQVDSTYATFFLPVTTLFPKPDISPQQSSYIDPVHSYQNTTNDIVSNENDTTNENVRRNTKVHKPPQYLSDYICNNIKWCNIFSFHNLLNPSKAFLISQSQWHEPTTYKEAIKTLNGRKLCK